MTQIRPAVIGLITVLTLTGTAAAAEVSISIEGVEARGGTLYVALQSEDQFMKEEGVDGAIQEAPMAGTATFTLNVPAGRYSLSVWHDENGNKVFDRTENGMPLDGWAMINGAELTGLPTFDFVSVDIPEAGTAITEAIVYSR